MWWIMIIIPQSVNGASEYSAGWDGFGSWNVQGSPLVNTENLNNSSPISSRVRVI